MNEEKFLPLMEVIQDRLAIPEEGVVVVNGVAGHFENAEWFWFSLYNELREYLENN